MGKKVLGLIALCLTTPSLWADVTVVRSLKLHSTKNKGSLEARSVMQIRGGNSRRETEVHLAGPLAETFHVPPKTITLVSLDRGVVHQLVFPNQEYEKHSLSQWRKRHADEATDLSRPDAPALRITQSWSRVIPADEVRTIKGHRCSKFAFEWRFQTENPETYSKKEYCVRTTLWLTPISPELNKLLLEEIAFKKAYHAKMGGAPLEELNGLNLKYAEGVTGLGKHALFAAVSEGTSRLQKIVGYPIASETEWILVGGTKKKPLFTVQSELEAVSLQPVPETAFAPSTQAIAKIDDADIDAELISSAK